MTKATETTTTETKAEETKGQKFSRLAVVRMNKVLEFMEKLEGLSNKNIYEYTPEQAEKIISVLEARTQRLKTALEKGKVSSGGFSL